jgi:hypothetical protein
LPNDVYESSEYPSNSSTKLDLTVLHPSAAAFVPTLTPSPSLISSHLIPQDKKDHILAEGVTVKKGARALEDDVAADTVDLKKEVKEQRMRQIAGQLELEEFDEINETHQGILTCQSYLREERPEVSCSCLISTYGLSTPVPLRRNALPLFFLHLICYSL